MEDQVFVRLFAINFKVDIVVHVLYTYDSKEPNDNAMVGWTTRIYYRDGLAKALHQGMPTKFTVLSWDQFPHQVVLYTVKGSVKQKKKKTKRKAKKNNNTEEEKHQQRCTTYQSCPWKDPSV